MKRIGIAGIALVAALGMAATTAAGASAVLTLEDGLGSGSGVPLEVGEPLHIEAQASFDFGSYNVVCYSGGYAGFVAKNKKATDELRFLEPLRTFRQLGEYGEGYCTVNGIPGWMTADVLAAGEPLSLHVGAKGVATLKATEAKKLVEFAFAIPSLSAYPFVLCYYGAAKFKGTNNATPVTVSEPTGKFLEAEFTEQPMKLGYADTENTPGYCPKKIDVTMKVFFGVSGKGELIYEHT